MANGRQDEMSRPMGLENGVARQRWARVEAEGDRQWLEWTGRFGVMSVEVV